MTAPDDDTRYNLRWWWSPKRGQPITWSGPESLAPTLVQHIVERCHDGPEVWEQLDEDATPLQSFWVITPAIARDEMVPWGPYDDYDHAVMIAALLR